VGGGREASGSGTWPSLAGGGAPFSVGVFCGSRLGHDPAHRDAAAALGEGIGRRGWRLVYGGGEVGLMGVVARSAQAAGATVLGVIPQRLVEREAAKRDASELRVTATMFERKELLVREADAFVVLPGGLGTLDEILDAVTLRQLGYHAKPVLLLDLGGYWRPCRALIEQFVAEGFAEPSAIGLCELVADVPAAVTLLEDAARGRRAGGPQA
jgi:uncharacterized protein (TIGR00730 family)